jgi:alcohol dehydrogenase
MIVYKEVRIQGALGVDSPAYRDALTLLAAGTYPFAELPRRVEPLENASELLATMAGEGDGPPPVHGVLVPS